MLVVRAPVIQREVCVAEWQSEGVVGAGDLVLDSRGGVDAGDDPVERADGTCRGGGEEGVGVAAPGGGVGGAG